MNLIWISAILGLLGAGSFLWALLLAARVRRLQRQLAVLGRDTGGAQESGYRLSVVVRNPAQLARERSRIGGRMIAFAPRLVTRRVYEIVARELGDELAARGVQAEIVIHAPD